MALLDSQTSCLRRFQKLLLIMSKTVNTDCMAHTLNKWTCLYGVVDVFMAGGFISA